jgi:hypothetical protein
VLNEFELRGDGLIEIFSIAIELVEDEHIVIGGEFGFFLEFLYSIDDFPRESLNSEFFVLSGVQQHNDADTSDFLVGFKVLSDEFLGNEEVVGDR